MEEFTNFLGIPFKGHAKKVERWISPFHTFNLAFENSRGNIGFPLGKMTEIYGKSKTGKSTIIYSLAGMIADYCNSNIALVDLEDYDPENLAEILVSINYSGHIYSIIKEKDEDTLKELVNSFWSDDPIYSVGILDAVGAISPLAERKGDVGEAHMGRRAKIMAQFVRLAQYAIRNNPKSKTLFMINHEYPKLGSYGYTQPGGEVKQYQSRIRIRLSREWRKKKEMKFSDGSYVVKGQVVDSNICFEDREFYFFILGGKGIHKGLTALYDAVSLDLSTVDNGVIKIGKNKFGRFATCLKKAHEGDDEFFQPFIDLLKEKKEEKDAETSD